MFILLRKHLKQAVATMIGNKQTEKQLSKQTSYRNPRAHALSVNYYLTTLRLMEKPYIKYTVAYTVSIIIGYHHALITIFCNPA